MMNFLTYCCASLLVLAVCFTGSTNGYGFRDVNFQVIVECETSEQIILHPDCTKYYQCTGNLEAILQVCNDGLFFNPIDKVCDFPENVPDCIGGTRDPGYEGTEPTLPTDEPEVTTPSPELTTPGEATVTDRPATTENPGGITCPAEGIEYVPDPTSCQSYYLCADGVAFPQSCAEGLLFDPIEKQCKIAEEVNCSVNPEPTTPKPDPEPTVTTGNPAPETTTGGGPEPGECPASGEILLPVEGDCSHYTWCVDGTGYPMECGIGTEFDPVAQACVLEADYECPFVRVVARKASLDLLSDRH